MRTFYPHVAIAGLLLLASPVVTVATTRTAYAQDDKKVELARAKFIEGVEAFDARKYADARDLFLQAYAIKRHPAVLLNLGLSELRSGDPVTAGAHLQQFLREFTQASPDQKQAARDGISEAKKSAGYIILIVDTDSAKVYVDGKRVGESPLPDPIFVAPGTHEVEARAGGKRVRSKVEATAGAMSSAQLNLKLGAAEAAPTESGKDDEEPKDRDSGSSGDGDSKTDGSWGSSNDLPPTDDGPYRGGFGAGSPSGKSVEEDKPLPSSRPSFFTWVKKKPAAIATLGIGGGLGLIGTIGFGAAAGSADGAVSDVTAAILAQTRNPSDPSGQLPPNYYDASGNPIPCGRLDDPTTAHPYYRGACDQLRSNLDAYDTDIALMATSLVVMTLSVGGTFAWYYVDTKKSTAATPESGVVQAFVTVAPIVTSDQKGLSLVGTF